MLLSRSTRRKFVFALAGVGAVTATQRPKKKQPELPRVGEFVRYVDPVTENILVRLTSNASASRLPAAQNAFISVKGRFLVFSSDRTGSFCPYLLDLRTGVIRQLAETSGLAPLSLMLDEAERSLYFINDGKLQQVGIANRHATTVSEGITAFSGRSERSLIVVHEGNLRTLAGPTLGSGVEGPCLLSPDGSACLVSKPGQEECDWWLAQVRPSGEAKPLVSGPVRFPFWAPDSRSVLFLRDVPGNGMAVSEIHRVSLDGGAEEAVALTTQFASFAPNSDASVFVGASRSKAQPTVDLLLRSVKRSMTLCEHRAKHPETVMPVFAPDSRRIYFESDRSGKSALYSMNVELLVEPTAT